MPQANLKMISFFKLVWILLFSFLVSPLYAASFDCNKAKTETEKAICRTAGGDSAEAEFSDSMQIAGEWSMKKLPAKKVSSSFFY